MVQVQQEDLPLAAGGVVQGVFGAAGAVVKDGQHHGGAVHHVPVPAEQWKITRLPGLVICAADEARAVVLRGLLGYWVSVPAAGLLTLGAAALIVAGTVKKRRAEREARERL